jgi:hypothetical protein
MMVGVLERRIGAMSSGQPFKASVRRGGKVLELTGKAP